MEALNTVVTAVLVIGVGILLRFSTKGQLDELKQDLRRVEDTLTSRMDRLEVRFNDFGRDVNAQLHAVRSDLTQLAIALGVQREAESGG